MNTINKKMLALLTISTALLLPSQTPAESRLVEEVVHSRALEDNLLGDTPDREVLVYLPPGYGEHQKTAYPVVYLLHGYTGTHTLWTGGGYIGGLNVQQISDRLIESGRIQPMILVMPNANNTYWGSFYTDSPATGNWEAFITGELVDHIDQTYRTIPQRTSRGLAGHSMGGFGTLKLAMEYPEVYVAAYAMSACCLDFVESAPDWTATLGVETLTQLRSAGFGPMVQVAQAAAFSPNPDKPPFYADFPFELRGGSPEEVPSVRQRWMEHLPLGMVDRYGANLLQLRGLRFDIGRSDAFAAFPPANRRLSAALEQAGIPHIFEEYDGTHTNRVVERMETVVLPFFSDILVGEPATAVASTSWATVKATHR